MDSNIPESVTESLYKQNLELAVKNKTLSLLKQLYQISILGLEPNILAEKIVNIVREILELDLVGILTLDHESDSLVPLKFSLSERLKESETNLHSALEGLIIEKASQVKFFEKVLQNTPNHTENIRDVWGGLVAGKTLDTLEEQSHIKNISSYPLVIDAKVTGVFIICFNRSYDKLSQYELESIESLVDVTAIAIDRARLYQEVKSANDKLRDLDQLKSEFLSLATHQIRAPLTAIKGYSSMILEGDYGDLPPKVKESVAIIFKSSQNLINIVADFLNISRIEQGRMVYEKSEFEVGELVKEVVEALAPNIQNAHLAIDIDVGKEKIKVNADRDKIKQVIANIVDNSIKYTPKGSIKISVSAEAGKAKVKVKDTGIGINMAEIGKLFEKFTRSKDANKTNVIGTGLGLYIAKKITEGHHGDIKVESAGVGKGSTFTIELPILT